MALLSQGSFLHYLANMSPLLIDAITAFYALYYKNTRATLFLAGALSSDVLNIILKQIGLRLLSKEITSRPAGGQHSWNLLEPFGVTADFAAPGMPSGHAQFAAFTAMYWYRYLYEYAEFDKMTPYYYLGLVLFCFFVMYSRVYISGCHTLLQVFAGALVGAVYGYYWFEFSEWYLHLPCPLVVDGVCMDEKTLA